MFALAALSALVGVSVWFDQSTFAPFADQNPIRYVLCTPTLTALLIDIAAAAAALTAACLIVERWWLAADDPAPRWRSAPLFAPLAIVALNLSSVGLLIPGLSDWWPPVAYVADSLHPAIWMLAVGLVAVNIAVNSDVGASLKRAFRNQFDAGHKSLLLEVGLAAAAAAIVVSTSPKIRFSGAPIGDEPKYLRYAENWWQGRGMDLDGIEDASAIPAAVRGPRLLQNVAALPDAVSSDVSQLIADAKYLGNWKHWDHRFNKAAYIGNWMVKGKNGGLYQMHQPGLSIVIFPAYALDRYLFDRGRSRFADDLFTVNLVLLMIWLMLGVTAFRLIDSAIGHRGVAFAVATASLASVPLATFAFPMYPETLAGLLVTIVTTRILSGQAMSGRQAAMFGAAIGWIVWLHVRFIVLAFGLFLWMLWTFRHDRRAVLALTIACGGVTAAFCYYGYHVTGSLLPSALYDTGSPDAGFRTARLPSGLLGVLFDRENGLIALAPMYLLALPGFGLMLRHQRRMALVLISVIGTLMITVAGHGYETSGTSPLRHMVAVTPLVAVAVATWVKSSLGRRGPVALTIVLFLVSIHFAAAYNLRNDKTITQTIASGISGWDPSFLFPLLRRTATSTFDANALRFWEIAAGVLLLVGLSRPRHAALSRFRIPRLGAIIGSLALIVVAGWMAFAVSGPRRESRLLETPQRALRACRLNCASGPGTFQVGRVP